MCRTEVIEELQRRIQSRMGNQVRNLSLDLENGGLILRGNSCTYYAKQLAQHTVLELTQMPLIANKIEVERKVV